MLRLLTSVRRLVPHALVLALAGGLFGASALPASAQEWSVNKSKSQVTLQISMDGQPVEGRFAAYRFNIDFDPEEPGHGKIAAEIDATSLSTGEPARDATLYGPDWLNAGAFPVIRVSSVRIRGKTAPDFRMEADVTLKGITKRVAVPMTVDDAGDLGRIQAEIPVSPAAFGIGQGTAGGADGMVIAIDLAATHLTN